MQIVFKEFPLKTALITPNKLALAVFFTLFIFTRVHRAVWPYLNTLSMLQIVLPQPFILVPVPVFVRSITMSHVVFPHAGVDVTGSVD